MPNAPLRACAEYPCPHKVTRGATKGRCPQHQKAAYKRIDANRGSSHARGYTRDWDVLRVQAFVRDGWRCQSCGWEPELVTAYREMGEGLPSTATMMSILRERHRAKQAHLEGDHIIPFGNRPELRLVLSNVQTLCSSCHKAKSRNEMMEGLGR